MNSHAPIISALKQGTIRMIVEEGQEKTFDIRGGVVKAQRNEVSLLVQ